MKEISANSKIGLLTAVLLAFALLLNGQVTVTGHVFAEIVERSEVESYADAFVSINKQDANKAFDMGEYRMNGSANACVSVMCDFTSLTDERGNAAPSSLNFYDERKDVSLDDQGSHVFQIQGAMDEALCNSDETRYAGEYKVTFLYN
jgi:hypothetical protein